MTVELVCGDNLRTLADLKAAGAKFDLVELDGPYMAGLEDWDTLTEAQYIQHYAERLSLVRDVLQPWGVVFVFGYPEGCAEIKSWAHRSGTLNCRRWITWYNQMARHEGRKTQTIVLFTNQDDRHQLVVEFGRVLKTKRQERGLSLRQLGDMAERPWWHRGGNLYYETGSGGVPSQDDYTLLKRLLDVPSEWDILLTLDSYAGVTNRDFVTGFEIEKVTDLNDAGLRSKPVGLYLDLFRPTIPPTDTRRALVLYGGSGNAGIAAAALGYDVTVCEASPERCDLIRGRWDGEVAKWTQKANETQPALFVAAEHTQPPLFSAAPP